MVMMEVAFFFLTMILVQGIIECMAFRPGESSREVVSNISCPPENREFVLSDQDTWYFVSLGETFTSSGMISPFLGSFERPSFHTEQLGAPVQGFE